VTEWLRLVRYTSSVIVARSTRPCGVLLPHLPPVGAKDRLEEFFAVPDLQRRALEWMSTRTARTVLAAGGYVLLQWDPLEVRVDLEGARSSTSAMARQEPGDLLGQLDHEPVWIEQMEGPVPPRSVHRPGEELDAEVPEPFGFGIDVVDNEEDFTGRPALGGLTVDQVGGACALEEPEPRLAGDELRVPRIAELEEEPDHVPIERRRHIHIADVEDQIADALHGHHRTTGCPQTQKLRELQGSPPVHLPGRERTGAERLAWATEPYIALVR
jgi:hypothetical protein